jgi:hypothetical protein
LTSPAVETEEPLKSSSFSRDGLDDLIVGAWGADPGNESKAGKSYVIVGKTDNTAINLSAIASGTGGFVINGENADDYSGFIVSTAGDVNSDGLDDLIVGASLSDPSGRTIAVDIACTGN